MIPPNDPPTRAMTEHDVAMICAIVGCSVLDGREKDRLCDLIRVLAASLSQCRPNRVHWWDAGSARCRCGAFYAMKEEDETHEQA